MDLMDLMTNPIGAQASTASGGKSNHSRESLPLLLPKSPSYQIKSRPSFSWVMMKGGGEFECILEKETARDICSIYLSIDQLLMLVFYSPSPTLNTEKSKFY